MRDFTIMLTLGLSMKIATVHRRFQIIDTSPRVIPIQKRHGERSRNISLFWWFGYQLHSKMVRKQNSK